MSRHTCYDQFVSSQPWKTFCERTQIAWQHLIFKFKFILVAQYLLYQLKDRNKMCKLPKTVDIWVEYKTTKLYFVDYSILKQNFEQFVYLPCKPESRLVTSKSMTNQPLKVVISTLKQVWRNVPCSLNEVWLEIFL